MKIWQKIDLGITWLMWKMAIVFRETMKKEYIKIKEEYSQSD